MEHFKSLLEKSASMHHLHLCPRQVLGVRMGIHAGNILGLTLPQSDKRLHTFVETDGCAADGISVATGCWIGRRTLHVLNFGKVAATFVDSQSGNAIRIHPHPEARYKWEQYVPNPQSRWHGYLEAYQIMSVEELFVVEKVELALSLEALISRPDARVLCENCSEEVFNDREVTLEGKTLCRACAGESYYRSLATAVLASSPAKHLQKD